MNPVILVSIASGFGTVLIIALINRRKISNLAQQLFGHDKSDDGGMVEEHSSIYEQLDRMEATLEEAQHERQRDHADVKRELRKNRDFYQTVVSNLIETLSEKDDLSEFDADIKDIEPNWDQTDD